MIFRWNIKNFLSISLENLKYIKKNLVKRNIKIAKGNDPNKLYWKYNLKVTSSTCRMYHCQNFLIRRPCYGVWQTALRVSNPKSKRVESCLLWKTHFVVVCPSFRDVATFPGPQMYTYAMATSPFSLFLLLACWFDIISLSCSFVRLLFSFTKGNRTRELC